MNLVFEQKGLDERIDHRSHAERGIEEQPTIHEGVAARAMEAKDFVSDRCELNRQIKADNLWLRIMKDAVAKLTAAFENTVAGIATALEAARERIIVSTYGIRHTANLLNKRKPSIDRRVALKQEYDEVCKSIRAKTAERKKLQAEKKQLSPIHVKRHMELASAITGLTEEIEELRSQNGRVLARARCEDDEDMKSFAEKLDQAKWDYNDLIERKNTLSAERQDGIAMYEDAYERIQPGEDKEVEKEQQRLRVENESRIVETVSSIYGNRFDPVLLSDAEKETDYDLIMDRRATEHRKKLHEQNRAKSQKTKGAR